MEPDDSEYEEWCDEVNTQVLDHTKNMFDGEDMPDVLDWYAAWEEGVHPSHFAAKLMVAAMEEMGF